MNKKTAFTIAEMIIAMTLMISLSVIAIKSINRNTPDEYAYKFKKIYGSISLVVEELINDLNKYPTPEFEGFTYTADSDGKKFYNNFKDFFNVLPDSEEYLPYNVPAVTCIKDGVERTILSKVKCFVDTKGITYCMTDKFTTRNYAAYGTLESIYIAIKIDNNSDINDILYININKNGKMSTPEYIKTDSSEVINCRDIEKSKQYLQCQVLAASETND